jgi:hypothetical protein
MEKRIINQDIEDSNDPTKILSYVYPLSVSSCAKTKNSVLTLYFDIRD